jgi:hypothetical protein
VLDTSHEAQTEMHLLSDYWLKLRSPGGLFMDTSVLETQGLNSSVEWINEVILARLSPDVFKTAIAEFFGYNVDFGSALLGEFGVDNVFDSGFDIVRQLSVEADLDSRKILAAVDGVAVRRALGSV